MSQEEIMKIFMARVEKAWQDAIQYPQPVPDNSGYEEGAWNKWLWHVVNEGDHNSWDPIVTDLEDKYNIYITYSSPFFTYYHKYGNNMRIELVEMAKQKEILFGRVAAMEKRKATEERYPRRNIEAPVPDWSAKKSENNAVIPWLDFRWKDMFG